MSVSNNLKQFRKKVKMTQTELAKRAGVSRQSIYAIETQKSEPSLELAFKLSNILGVAITDLFIWNENQINQDDAIPAYNIF